MGQLSGAQDQPRAEWERRQLGFTQGWEGTETICAGSSLSEQRLLEAGSGQRVWGSCSVRGKKAKVSDYLNWIKFCLAGFEEILFAL